MRSYLKKIIVLITVLLQSQLINTASAQFPSVIVGNSPDAGVKEYVACQEIRLQPGYTFKATTTDNMHAYIWNCSPPSSDACEMVNYTDNNPTDAIRSLNTSLPVGTTAGSFAVSPTGAATYFVPLVVPPGTRGMAPNLSISYNSQGGNGLLGMGWNLSGLSAISRTGKTFFHDGFTQGIQLDGGDHFNFDGARLILATGTYGVDASTYHTETETFMQFTAHGSGSTGPDYFIVTSLDGTIYEYGNSTDSRVEAPYSSIPLFWLLNKVTDASGNYMTLTYTENTTTGECVPQSIYYNYLGSNPNSQIKFNYISRNDPQITFLMGYQISSNLLLDNIEVKYNGQNVHKYQLGYENELFSHLASITESGTDGVPYNSTIIKWKERTSEVICAPNTSHIAPEESNYIGGDFNADGKTDFIRVAKTGNDSKTFHYNYNAGNNTFGEINTGSLPAEDQLILYGFSPFYSSATQSMDVNGDGFDDFIVQSSTINLSNNPPISVKYFTPYISDVLNGLPQNTFTVGSRMIIAQSYQFDYPVFGDFNGDGRTDIFLYRNYDNLWHIYTGTTAGLVFLTSGVGQSDWINYPFQAVDFNGDGKSEIMVTKGLSSVIYELSATNTLDLLYDSQPVYGNTYIFPYADHKLFSADYNGDGKTDFLSFEPNTASWYLYYGTGLLGQPYISITPPISGYPSPDDPNYKYDVGDFNGDGKSDIQVSIHPSLNRGNHKVIIWYGRGDFTFTSESSNTSQLFSKSNALQGDFNGDGKMDLFVNPNIPATPAFIKYFHPNEQKELVGRIINGMNSSIKIQYEPITNDAVYHIGNMNPMPFPVINIRKPIYVVANSIGDNGIGGETNMSYQYTEAKFHLQGKGFMGFSSTLSTNNTTGFNSFSSFNFDPVHFFPKLISTSVSQGTPGPGSTPVSSTTNSYTVIGTGGLSYFAYIDQQTSNDYIKNTFNNSTYTFDSFGNVTHQSTDIGTIGSSPIVTSVNNIAWNYPNQGTWFRAQKASAISTTTRSGQTPFISETHWNNYNLATNLPGQIVSNPNSAGNSVTTDIGYDSFGNLISTTASGSGVASRTNTISYDQQGRFAVQQTNALGHQINVQYENAYGNITQSTDANGLVTSYTYDGFGRLKQSTLPTGQVINSNRDWSIGYPTSASLFFEENTTINEAPIKTYYDIMGRAVRNESKGFNSTSVFTDMVYNNKGQLESTSKPYFTSDAPQFTIYNYDLLGRVISQTSTNGVQTTFTYSGTTSTASIILPSGTRNYTQVTDAAGMVIQSTDPAGSIDYVYHSSGNPLTITAAGATSTMEYNDVGLQTKLIDPDAGTTLYEYNALGEITKQTDAKNNVYEMTYDLLGRVLTRNGMPDDQCTYTYDPVGALGATQSMSHNNGTSVTYTYDPLVRLLSETETINGQVFTTSYTYDSNSRINKVTYPGGFGVKQIYNSNGYLLQLLNASNNSILWRATGRNALNQLLSAEYGNGIINERVYSINNFFGRNKLQKNGVNLSDFHYIYDETTGNLSSRTDVIKNLSETFEYDNLDRLISWQNNLYTATYAANGNITNKSDVGNYTYDPTNKPHAVTGITNPNPLLTGLMQQDVVYNAFNKTMSITEANDKLEYTYGPHQMRSMAESFKKNITSGNYTDLMNTRYYAKNTQKDINAAGERQVDYILSPEGLVALHVINTPIGGNAIDSIYYVHEDNMGGIGLISNTAGVILEERSYDAWGRLRNPADWTYNNVNPLGIVNRGYTGHEHLTAFNLINMNARLYDPIVARVLSPDNYVQDDNNTQSYNRYSYVTNNPLKYSDPTGNVAIVDDIAAAAIGGTFNVISNWDHINSFGQGAAYFGIGAVGGWVGLYTAGAGGGALIALGNGLMQHQSAEQIGQNMIMGAVGGAVGYGLASGIGGADFGVDKITNNFGRYAAKAGISFGAGFVAGFGGSVGAQAAGVGAGWQVEYDFKSAAMSGLAAGGTAAGLSIAFSVYDYATWDKYNPDQKVAILNEKYGSNIHRITEDQWNTMRAQYTEKGFQDPGAYSENYGITSPKNHVNFITDKGLGSRDIANMTTAHEVNHRFQYKNGVNGGTRTSELESIDCEIPYVKSTTPYRQVPIGYKTSFSNYLFNILR